MQSLSATIQPRNLVQTRYAHGRFTSFCTSHSRAKVVTDAPDSGQGEVMNYVISSDEPAFVVRHARVASDALMIAEDLANEGRTDVKVTTPEGQALPLRQFAILVREDRSAA